MSSLVSALCTSLKLIECTCVQSDIHTFIQTSLILPSSYIYLRPSQGLHVPLTLYDKRVVHVREWPFLDHPKVPDAIKSSRVELFPAGAPRQPRGPVNSLAPVRLSPSPEGSARAGLPWPLNAKELEEVRCAWSLGRMCT
jgi:hypothetical protein